MTVAISHQAVPSGVTLLMSAREKFAKGKGEEALEDFKTASARLPTDLIQKVYWHVWDLSQRPVGNSNFGEDAMYNRLVSQSPPDWIKAAAIERVVLEYHRQTVGRIATRLEYDSSCPISGEIMQDPVIDQDGHTFDRASIEGYRHYLRQNGYKVYCPISNSSTPASSELITNYAAKSIVDMQQQYAGRLNELDTFFQQLEVQKVQQTPAEPLYTQADMNREVAQVRRQVQQQFEQKEKQEAQQQEEQRLQQQAVQTAKDQRIQRMQFIVEVQQKLLKDTSKYLDKYTTPSYTPSYSFNF